MFFKKPKARTIITTIGEFQVEVSYKAIKNIYLKVSRSTGLIRVSAPLGTSSKLIQEFVQTRHSWIKNHLAKKVQKQDDPKYAEGEILKVFGSKVSLNIEYTNKNIFAYLHNNELILRVKKGFGKEKRQKVAEAFYRKELKVLVAHFIEKWMPIMGVEVKDFGIKKMKTRWGTCNITDQRIWINLHLAKEKPEVIELVVVHEMVHLLERLHNKRFYALMEQFLPNHRELEKELDGKVC